MNISFQKTDGIPSLGIEFFWMMAIKAKSAVIIKDHFIPELYYDYIFVKEGCLNYFDQARQCEQTLPQQTLRTLFTQPITFTISTPLTLFGARFSLRFAESYWGNWLNANSFLEQSWVSQNVKDLSIFQSQITAFNESHQQRKHAYPMLSATLSETDWLRTYSPRHKRRLYKATFGVSRKEMERIRTVHLFLDQSCDFAAQYPRIIQHINPELFYDQPHLNNAFKKIAGLSPLEYFEASSVIQDNLMAASYNEIASEKDKI